MVEILVKEWLTYIVAFAAGMSVALLGRYMAFSVVMSSGMGFSMAGFVGFVILLPVLVGVAVFAMIYAMGMGDKFTGGEWLNAFAFTFAITIMCVGLILSRAMAEMPAMILLAALIFVGGRVLLSRRKNA